MTTTSVSKKDFNEYFRVHFLKVSKNAISINVYTVIRCIVMTCETYSYKKCKLYSGGIYNLTIRSIEPCVTHLLAHRLISSDLYNELMFEYNRDRDTAIPAAVCEFIIIVRRSGSKQSTQRSSTCCTLM